MVNETIETEQNITTKYILIGRCQCDNLVASSFFWAEELIPFAKERGWDVIDLQIKNFCKVKFKELIETKNPSLVFLNGHGDDRTIKGYKEESVIILGENDHLLKNKIAHIISCKAGTFLAQSFMDKGCKGFLGYDGDFNMETGEKIVSNLFKEVVNTASKILIDCGNLKEAYKRSHEIYERNINFCKEVYFKGFINFGVKLSDDQRDSFGRAFPALEKNKNDLVFMG
jgi:hypothetical protein